MERRQVLSIISLICYLIFVALGAFFALGLYADSLGGNTSNGIGGAIVTILIAVLMIIAIIYALIGIVPSLMKLVNIFWDSKIPSIVCIPFDLVYLAINGYFIYNTLSDTSASGFEITLAVFAVATFISLVAFVCNIACIKE